MSTARPSSQEALHSARPLPHTRVFVGGVVPALFAALLWSTSSLLIDRLVTIYHLQVLEITTWRVLFALPIIIVAVAVRRPAAFTARGGDLPLYVAAGITGVTISYISWAASIEINKPAVASALAYSAPAFVAIGDRLVFGARLRPLQIAAIAATLVGCGVVSRLHSIGDLTHSWSGLLIGLSTGLTFAVYALLGRGMTRSRSLDAQTFLLYMFLFGFLGVLAWGVPAEGTSLFQLHLDTTGWLLLVALAVGPTLGAYALFNHALRVLPATIASMVTSLEPPIVAIMAFVFLGQPVHSVQWLGIALIVGGVVLVDLGGKGG